MDLNTAWYILVGVLIGGYALLDGFDLGVGVLSLFGRSPEEKRLHMRAIGPVWDGNEVWLLTAGGALFAAFPSVYATVFSGFYLALMLVLLALILRAVSLEFYSKVDSAGWRSVWMLCFGVGSLLPAILFGVAFGNILRGIPITQEGQFAGSFIGLLNPYALLIGVLSLFMFVMHGAAYMATKTDGELRERMGGWAGRAWLGMAVCYVAATFFTMRVNPVLFDGLLSKPLFYLVLVPLVVSIPCVPAMLRSQRWGMAFIASCVLILCMIGMAGVSMFPRLVPSTVNIDYSLTAYNASSTQRTLGVMLIIALIGMPLVIVYTAFIYWIFRGKVKAEGEGY